jgi:hypothetical protein
MTNRLEEAIARISTLPAATQESIAEELLAHVRKVEHLRTELQKGITSLDRGRAAEVNVEDVIARARKAHGRK